MIKTVNGIPGSGKNVLCTYFARKHFRKENNFLRKFIRRILHQPVIVNNVYTTYPVLLKKGSKIRKKPPIYSQRVTIFDLVPSNRFLKNAFIVIDETQVFFDSEEYKEFPKDIATFNQFHRHFGVSDIIYITQHPSRLMKKLRILCSEFDKVKTFINIPIINIALIFVVKYFEFDDYGKYNHPKKEARTYDFKNCFFIFRSKPVFNSYDSTYMRVLNENSPLYDIGTFNSSNLSKNEIEYIYRNRI